jgi:dethiobiotin synthetase
MSVAQGYFITGTDTHVGKTWVTVALMRMFKQQGLSVAGMKPVAAGCEWQQGQWKNEDALLIQEHASVNLPYQQINPYAFKLPLSPHLACEGTTVDINVLQENLKKLKQQVDVVLVEGAGGWFSPLGETFNNAYLAEAMQLPIIMVVAIRLGCINHALLTWLAIQASAVECAGWVAVKIDNQMLQADENIQYLQKHINAPLVGVLPHLNRPDFDKLAHIMNGYFTKS